MANVGDLYYDFCNNKYTHDEFNDLIIKHNLYEKFSNYIGHIDYDSDEMLRSIDIRAIETGNTKYLDIPRLPHIIQDLFRIACKQGRPLVIKYIINKYPNLVGLNNTFAINVRRCMTTLGPLIHSKQKQECLIMLLHHFRYNRSVSVICKRIPNFLDYVEDFIEYSDTQNLNRSQFKILINAIQELYGDMIRAYIPKDIFKSKNSAELIGIYIYKNWDIYKKLRNRFTNIGNIIIKYLSHISNKYTIYINDIRDFHELLIEAITNFNIFLIIPLSVILLSEKIRSISHICSIDNYTNIAILYLYEYGVSINACFNEKVMSMPLFTIREQRAKETAKCASKYVIDDIAQIIGAYVPFELVEIKDLINIKNDGAVSNSISHA